MFPKVEKNKNVRDLVIDILKNNKIKYYSNNTSIEIKNKK